MGAMARSHITLENNSQNNFLPPEGQTPAPFGGEVQRTRFGSFNEYSVIFNPLHIHTC